jgi:ribosome-binding factor A
MVGFRRNRVADEIKRIIGEIFVRDLIGEKLGFITVMKVVCSPDLKLAKVYLSVYENDPQKRKVRFQEIKKRAARIRGLLGTRISLRYVPQLQFFEDDTLLYAEKIERLIQTIQHNDELNDE